MGEKLENCRKFNLRGKGMYIDDFSSKPERNEYHCDFTLGEWKRRGNDQYK